MKVIKILCVLFVFVILFMMILDNKERDYNVYYVSGSQVDEQSYQVYARTFENKYEYIEVSTNYELQSLFNEHRNVLPNNYYIDYYSNYDLIYFDDSNMVVNCVIENYRGNVENFLICFVNTFLNNNYNKVNIKINDVLYIYSNLII